MLGVSRIDPIHRISQHHYSAAFCQGGDFPLTSFMNKQYVRGNLSIFEADIAETYSRGLTYILGYVSFWGGLSCASASC